MKNSIPPRRVFLEQSSLGSLGAILTMGLIGCNDHKNLSRTNLPQLSGHKTKEKIPLKNLLAQYRHSLFNNFLPNMESLVIDHEYGGFMCSLDIETRKLLSTEKRVWSEGRGIWVYSFLYNNFGRDSNFLEVAKKSKDFILKHRPEGHDFWISSYSRQGIPNSNSGDIYGNLYLAEGLTEFAKASGEHKYMVIAKNIMLYALERYDSSDYKFSITYGPPNVQGILAPRVLAHWMVFLRSVTQFLKQKSDPDIENLAYRCIEAIMKHHLNPDYRLLNDGLNHDFSLPKNGWAQFSQIAIGIQTLWMVMSEAIRIKDSTLFKMAGSAFKRHVQVAVDPVYGGYFQTLENVATNTFRFDKVLSLHAEILIGTLLLIEHTEDNWARECFIDTYDYVQDKFIRSEFAFPVESGNRKMTEYGKKGMGNYHYPRQLMLNSLALERIIGRKGNTSGVLG